MEEVPLPGMTAVEAHMTLPQIEQEFGIPYRTAHAAVRSGRLPEIQHSGRRIIVTRANAEQFRIRYQLYKSSRKG